MRAFKIIVLPMSEIDNMSELNKFALASYFEGIGQHYKFAQGFLEAAICLMSKIIGDGQ